MTTLPPRPGGPIAGAPRVLPRRLAETKKGGQLSERGLSHRRNWRGKRGSNSRPQPWQGCALPTELFPRRKTQNYSIRNGTVKMRAPSIEDGRNGLRGVIDIARVERG